MNIRETLPVHPSPNHEMRPGEEMNGLEICGLAGRPHLLSSAELGALPRERLTERFVCEEGWAVENMMWEGIRLHEVLALGEPLEMARYVRVCAGAFWLALALGDLDHVLLCDCLNDEPLAREHGAPWRLVLPGGACFTSVKWVHRLELTLDAGEPTAERIARARLTIVQDSH